MPSTRLEVSSKTTTSSLAHTDDTQLAQLLLQSYTHAHKHVRMGTERLGEGRKREGRKREGIEGREGWGEEGACK